MSTKTYKPLPPVRDLFTDSWKTFKQSVLNLFIVSLVSAGVYIGLALIIILVSLPFGIISVVTSLQAKTLTPAAISSMGVIGGLVLAGIVAAILYSLAAQAARYVFVGTASSKPHFGVVFKKSFHYIWPLFLLGLVTAVIVAGGYFLLIIPGIFFAILFSFAPFELILNKKGVLDSLRRSQALVLARFWGILSRMLLWFIIAMLVYIVPNAAFSANQNAAGYYSPLSAIINILLGWFGICYAVTLYKQAAAGMDSEKGGKLLWPVIVGIVGWVVGFIILVGSISLIAGLVAQAMRQNQIKSSTPPPYAYPMMRNRMFLVTPPPATSSPSAPIKR